MPQVEERLSRLERLVISGRQGGLVGSRWRFDARPWPTVRDDECLVFQAWKGEDWVDVIVVKPDGTIQPA